MVTLEVLRMIDYSADSWSQTAAEGAGELADSDSDSGPAEASQA